MTPAVPVCLESVRLRGARPEWYDEYRRLRYRTFVVEQGWSGLCRGDEPGMTTLDPTDEAATFWLARSAEGGLIGAVRVCAITDAFPHEDLFAHHLMRPEVRAVLPCLGTLNSLLVAHEWRRRPCQDSDDQPRTVSQRLLRAALSGCADAGLCGLVATAQTVISARALMRVGFHVLDAPVRTALHAVFPMCNMGIVLPSSGGCEAALARYLERRHLQVLRVKSIEEWYASPAAVVAGAA